jgi:hypothetical protein
MRMTASPTVSLGKSVLISAITAGAPSARSSPSAATSPPSFSVATGSSATGAKTYAIARSLAAEWSRALA